MKYQYKRNRSDFWITIHQREDFAYNISVPNKYVELINFFFPMLESNSPTKWKQSENYPNLSNLWLPEGHYRQITIEQFMNWCEKATSNMI